MEMSNGAVAVLGFLFGVGLNLVLTGRWTGRIDALMTVFADEVKSLRESRHDYGNMIQVHEARLREGETRMETMQEEIVFLRKELSMLVKIESRLDNIEKILEREETT